MACQEDRIECVKGNSIDGIDVELLVNDQPKSLAYTDIEAIFTYEPQLTISTYKETLPASKTFTIDDGISDVIEAQGKYTILKNTVLDWEKGKWNFAVTYTFPNETIKTWTFGTLWII